mgnify:FL=1
MSKQFTNVVKITEGASFFMNVGDISNNTLEHGGSNGLNSAVGVEGIKGSSTMEMTGGTITGNTAEYDGILVGTYSTNYTMQNNFSNPAHYYSTGTLNLKGGTISNNTAAVLGGGIAVNGTGKLTMDGGTISGNKAPFGGGIGVVDYLTSPDGKRFGEARWRGFFPASVTINDGLITGNEATMTAVTSQITDPNAENGVGGGIYVASKEVYINGGQFTNNSAGKQGGAIYVATVPYKLQMGKTLVTGNTATKIGGGMWLCPTGSATTAVTNGASFFDNKAGNGAENNDTGSAGDDVASINKEDPATQTLILSNNVLDNWLVHSYEDGKIDEAYLCNSDGSVLDTTGISESEIFQAKVDKLMTSGAATFAQIDQVALSNANDWKFKFVDLLKYDMVNDAQDTTNPNIYFVREMDTDGNWVANDANATFGAQQIRASYKATKNASGAYDHVITNEEVKLREIEVTKKWVGDRESKVEIQLYKNGNPLGSSRVLEGANNWATKFDNLEVRDAGATEDNVYSVREVGEANNAIKIGEKHYKVSYSAIEQDGKMTITNTKNPTPKKDKPPTPNTGDGFGSGMTALFGLSALGLLVLVYNKRRRYQ